MLSKQLDCQCLISIFNGHSLMTSWHAAMDRWDNIPL